MFAVPFKTFSDCRPAQSEYAHAKRRSFLVVASLGEPRVRYPGTTRGQHNDAGARALACEVAIAVGPLCEESRRIGSGLALLTQSFARGACLLVVQWTSVSLIWTRVPRRSLVVCSLPPRQSSPGVVARAFSGDPVSVSFDWNESTTRPPTRRLHGRGSDGGGRALPHR
jgi:hypothetical protein